MKRSLLDIIKLGSDDRSPILHEFAAGKNTVDYGVLVDPHSNSCRAILSGFPLLNESMPPLAEIEDVDTLKSIEKQLCGDQQAYEQFVASKWRRPNRDAYAAFQPFNESTRALYPLVPLLRERLRPGDYILDTWCRTGWTGELLAALFPQQKIVSIWEGNHGLLSYRAFRYWLSAERRASNLDILFHDVNQPLPFVSCSFAAVVGLDTLHRYDVDNLLAECQRICVDDAPIIFPHVHLTNSKPEPWFDRGCRQEHGLFWRDYLEQALATPTRQVYIESEMALFHANQDSRIHSNPLTTHYNALVGLLPASWSGAALATIDDHFDSGSDSYVILNPLLDIDLNRLQVSLDHTDEQGMVEHILTRHPGYADFLGERLPMALTADQARLLYWVRKPLTVAEIAARLQITPNQMVALLAPLVAAEVALVLPVSPGMAHLNYYFSQQLLASPPAAENLVALWRTAVAEYADNIYVSSIEDDMQLSYADLNQLVEVAAGRLLAELSAPEETVAVAAQPGLETVLLFWACQRAGLRFAAIDPDWPAARVAAIVDQHKFKLLFTDIVITEHTNAMSLATVILLESDAAPMTAAAKFEDWLQEHAVATLPEAEPHPDTTAVVLFTSGTTGKPKGVQLSHRALWQSAHSFSRYYGWRSNDVFLSLGHYATMSGLRNSLIVTAAAGSSFLIPEASARKNVLEAVSLMGKKGVTIMGVVPAFLKQLTALAKRLDAGMFTRLRLLLSTAANLPPQTAQQLWDALGVAVRNYYGLTETSGACIFTAEQTVSSGNCIGRPYDAIAQIVGLDGELLATGVAGELRVYSGNLMQGYLDEPESSQAMMGDGWLYTGDICRWSEAGDIELLDRKRDMIKAPSGALVFVSEIEMTLAANTVFDEVSVVRLASEHGSDRLICFVPGQQEVAADELLSSFNTLLRGVLSPDHQLNKLAYVDALPRGANAKVRKDELVRQYMRTEGVDQL
jgi:acyl-CoA synthetase (AMP-forming)/AMP-acid ligase II/SAM-dependent methyltransferase